MRRYFALSAVLLIALFVIAYLDSLVRMHGGR